MSSISICTTFPFLLLFENLEINGCTKIGEFYSIYCGVWILYGIEFTAVCSDSVKLVC